MRRLALPRDVSDWSLRSIRLELLKIEAKVVSHSTVSRRPAGTRLDGQRWREAARWSVELEQRVKNDRGERKIAMPGVAYGEIPASTFWAVPGLSE